MIPWTPQIMVNPIPGPEISVDVHNLTIWMKGWAIQTMINL
jgi:hypothetical protein